MFFEVKNSSFSSRFPRFAFSPTVLLSYRLNKRNMLRLRLDSETAMPDIQQMSGNRILIMENFNRRGNAVSVPVLSH